MQHQQHPLPHRRPMPWRAALAVAGLALMLLLFLVARDTFDPLRRSEAQRQAEQAAQLDQQLSTVDLFVAAFLRIAVPGLALAGLVSAGYIGLALAYNRWARLETIKADKVIALEQARAQRFPAGLQSLSYHDSSRPQAIEPPPLIEPPALTSPIPTFGQLLDQGRIGQGRPLLLGYDASTGAPIEGSWESLYTAGIGGLQGSGKTWAAVFLLAQSALQGAKFIICDPHAHDSESLAARLAPLRAALLCDVASDDRSILAALKLADSKLQGRKAGTIAGRWPIVVAIDEFLALRRGKLADALPPLIEGLSTEGRKLGCYALLLAQRWDKTAIGDFRNTLASSFVYRMRPAEARMLTGMQGESVPDDTLTLAPGECYLLDTRGDCRKVIIPQMAPADIARVGELLAEINRPAQRPIGFSLPKTAPLPVPLPAITPAASVEGAARRGNEGAPDRAPSTAAQCSGRGTPEQARALALYQGGMGVHEVVKEVWGIKGGSAYQLRAAELHELIRQAMKDEA